MQHDPLDDDVYKNAHLLGIDPHLPFHDLNLAGSQGLPDPSSIAHPTIPPSTNSPTFTQPTTDVPQLAPYDLTSPAIDLHNTLQADPLLPDLSTYTHPYGLDIQPPLADSEMQSDPLLPDLQHTDLTQQTHMPARPGDLADDALDTMHLDLTYQQLAAKTYPEVFLDQTHTNTTRSRHMNLLMRGLDQEER